MPITKSPITITDETPTGPYSGICEVVKRHGYSRDRTLEGKNIEMGVIEITKKEKLKGGTFRKTLTKIIFSITETRPKLDIGELSGINSEKWTFKIKGEENIPGITSLAEELSKMYGVVIEIILIEKQLAYVQEWDI